MDFKELLEDLDRLYEAAVVAAEEFGGFPPDEEYQRLKKALEFLFNN